MRDACLKAVSSALGRAVSEAEARGIETRVSRHMRLLARADAKAWSAKPEAERLTEAGKAAAKELIAEATLKRERLEARILKKQNLDAFVSDQVATGKDKLRTEAVYRILAPEADMGGTPTGGAVDQVANAVYADAVARMIDVFEAGKRRGIWRFVPFNEPGTSAMLRRALAGLTEGVPAEFKRMADVANDAIDLLRRRYNAAGGEIGKLEDWGEPHRWSAHKLAKAINKMGRAKVAEDFANAADPRKYVKEDGTLMSKDEIRQFMDNALTTILTDGANKRIAGEKSDTLTGLTANRHRAHREIHLRAEAVEMMLNTYSDLDAMSSLQLHLRVLARDVALIETFGPHADLTFKQMLNEAFDQDVVAFETDKGMKARADRARKRTETLFGYLAGGQDAVESRIGDTLQTLRSLKTFAALGMTTVSSITDPVVMQFVARSRGLDHGKLWLNDVAQFAGGGRRWAKRAGLITDTVVGYAERIAFDNLTSRDMASRAASFTIKASFLNWVTEARRAAWGMTMMDGIGHLVRHYPDMGRMKADDQRLARLMNIDQQTWDVWRLAKLETRGANHTLLSPQSIYAIPDDAILNVRPDADPQITRTEAATRLLGIIKDETNTAVNTAGSKERASMTAGTRAGTVQGELLRSIVLFRSYPWTFMARQLQVAETMGGGANRFAYGASLFVTLSLTGIMANWIRDLLEGRELGTINPTSTFGRRNIIAGATRGGGLGFFGDFLFANSDPSNRSQSLAAGVAGPVVSDLDELQQLTIGNLNQASQGQETNAGPEAMKFVQRHTVPNFWYSKALMDRYVFNALMEEVEPGYLGEQMNRQENARGTRYWWPLDEKTPTQAPDLSTAVTE